MPDLEFLPAWYPNMRRRRRRIVIQTWCALAFLASLAGWIAVSKHNIFQAEKELESFDIALNQSRKDLARLDELLELEKQLVHQEKVLATVGAHIDSARLLTALDELMPREMALLELRFDTEEKKPGLAGLAAKTPAPSAAPERVLKLRMVGVAPNDVDLAEFLTRLTARPYFSDVTLTYTRDRRTNGHVMREFEVLFSTNLTKLGA